MWEICKDLQDEIVTMRRDLHQIPEIGGDLPETKAYVIKKLTEMGRKAGKDHCPPGRYGRPAHPGGQ